MGKHRKTEDLNTKPYDVKASGKTKAKEFDQQYNQNRTYTNTPTLDNHEKRRKGDS
jgi:hypothetical protein